MIKPSNLKFLLIKLCTCTKRPKGFPCTQCMMKMLLVCCKHTDVINCDNWQELCPSVVKNQWYVGLGLSWVLSQCDQDRNVYSHSKLQPPVTGIWLNFITRCTDEKYIDTERNNTVKLILKLPSLLVRCFPRCCQILMFSF